MVPLFPKFKKVEIDDQPTLKKFTRSFLPYSDFNFVSMLGWGHSNNIRIARCNNNLVVRFKDYNSSHIYHSVLGQFELEDTIQRIISWEKKHNVNARLHMVPAEVINNLNTKTHEIKEEVNNHDYVYSLSKLVALQGRKYKKKRNLLKKFKDTFGKTASVKLIKLEDPLVKRHIRRLFRLWAQDKRPHRDHWDNEYRALRRLLQHADKLHLYAYGLYINNVMVGFSINERVSKKYIMTHYEKIARRESGISEFFIHSLAAIFKKKGFSYLNYQQDMGLDGLRLKKRLLRPEYFLKKYSVGLKTD